MNHQMLNHLKLLFPKNFKLIESNLQNDLQTFAYCTLSHILIAIMHLPKNYA